MKSRKEKWEMENQSHTQWLWKKKLLKYGKLDWNSCKPSCARETERLKNLEEYCINVS